MKELLHPDCIPQDESVTFGYNVQHTSKANAEALVSHWVEIGFLEFQKVWRSGGMRPPVPTAERWHMLRDDEKSSQDEPVHSDDEGERDHVELPVIKTGMYGSKGPLLPVTFTNLAGFTEPIRDDELLVLEDPMGRPTASLPVHDPRNPAWTPPCIVPNTSWSRGQYVFQSTNEVRGAEMQAVHQLSLALVQCEVRIM